MLSLVTMYICVNIRTTSLQIRLSMFMYKVLLTGTLSTVWVNYTHFTAKNELIK